MAYRIPLIQASSLVPMLKWMLANGRDTEAALKAVALGWYPWDNPTQPIPLLNGIEFLRNLSREEGADIPFRVVGDTGLFDLAMLSRVALGTRSPLDALERIAQAMPFHCSRETISMSERDGCFAVRDQHAVSLDQEARHLLGQYFAAMLAVLFRLTDAGGAWVAEVSMAQHPQFGFDHLKPWRRQFRFAHALDLVEMRVPVNVARGTFRKVARDRTNRASTTGWEPLQGDGTLTHSIGMLLPGLLRDGHPGIDQMAGYAQTSRRTLQRQLAEEGHVYSDIVDSARMRLLDQLVAEPHFTLREISERLGFAGQSTLTRASMKWVGKTPSQVRAHHFQNNR